MDETRRIAESVSGEDGGADALGPGLPVGRTRAGGMAPLPAAAPLPSWVVPMIVLALVAGLGIGLALGLLLDGRGDADQAATTSSAATTTGAPSTIAVSTTVSPAGPSEAYGAAITVTGNPLPVLGSAATDTAVGLPVPEITGTDFAGNTVSIAANGKAKLIVALAHWCPYCNEEVPVLMDWYAAGVPEGVEVISLHVYSDSARANFPPATWVADRNWLLPLIADDQARTLAASLGIPAVPFWLLVGADGTVLARTTGQRDTAFLDAVVAALVDAETTTTVP